MLVSTILILLRRYKKIIVCTTLVHEDQNLYFIQYYIAGGSEMVFHAQIYCIKYHLHNLLQVCPTYICMELTFATNTRIKLV